MPGSNGLAISSLGRLLRFDVVDMLHLFIMNDDVHVSRARLNENVMGAGSPIKDINPSTPGASAPPQTVPVLPCVGKIACASKESRGNSRWMWNCPIMLKWVKN